MMPDDNEALRLVSDASWSEQDAMIDTIRPGLHRIEVPLPDSPLKSINSYVVRSEDRNLVIDTGMLRPECEAALREGLERLEVDLAATDFFITHLHADHIGLISVFATASSTVYFNRADAEINQRFVDDREGVVAWLIDGARSAGFPEDEIQNALLKHPGFKYSPPEFPPFTFLEDGDRVRAGRYDFEIVSTPGHTPGHQCLYEAEHALLLSGDHILGDITPNITVWTEDGDALGQYLASLERVRDLDVELVLPGHRSVVTDCHARIAELERHHQHRLDEITSIVESGPCNAYQAASQMTWDISAESWRTFPVVQKWFAVSEAVSHLRHLVRRDIVAGTRVEGVIQYDLKETG